MHKKAKNHFNGSPFAGIAKHAIDVCNRPMAKTVKKDYTFSCMSFAIRLNRLYLKKNSPSFACSGFSA